MKIEYEGKKWIKEIKRFKDFKKQVRGAFNNNELYTISIFVKEGKKDYLRLYSRLSGNYEQMATYYYLDNTNCKEINKYTYLSGQALLITKALFNKGIRTEYSEIIENQLESDIDYALFQLIAVDELENPYTKIEENNLIVLMYYQKYEEAMVLLNQLPDEPDESNTIYYIAAQYLKKIYMAIINRDEKNFNEELAKRIKKYRKNMVGYSTIIDIASVGLIKIAERAGIQCTVDVIEIPKQYFDEFNKLNKDEIKLPFYDEFLAAHLLQGYSNV